ncbi:hypothetical protein BgiBS90_024781, partial [Biomphalaria glabrata]
MKVLWMMMLLCSALLHTRGQLFKMCFLCAPYTPFHVYFHRWHQCMCRCIAHVKDCTLLSRKHSMHEVRQFFWNVE